MSLLKVLVIMLVAIVVAVVIVGGCAYSGYNKAVALDEGVNNAWAQVENQLQRRFDLLPNLVETVKGIAGHEDKVFLGLAAARKSYFQAQSNGTTADKARAAGGLTSALSRLLVFSENYPQLRSNESFLKLQDSIEGTENRLSVERKRYNDAVSLVNTFTRKLLGRLYASFAGVGQAEYFKVSEETKVVPKVSFTDDAKGG